MEDDVPRTHHHTFADNATRTIAVATVSGLAGLAGWISYHHMLLLAQRAGEIGVDAHAFPLTVDGLDLIGVLVLLADRRTGRPSGWLPWSVLTAGTVASISANIAVAPDNPVARAISGWSAVALLAAAKMLAHLFEPTDVTDAAAPDVRPTAQAQADTPTAADTNDAHRGDAVNVRRHLRRRVPGDAARRVPTSDVAQAKWRAIWEATKHLDRATPEVAAAHDVSLRTLQFIRAAGQDGQLSETDIQPHPHATTGALALTDGAPAHPNHHGTLTGALS